MKEENLGVPWNKRKRSPQRVFVEAFMTKHHKIIGGKLVDIGAGTQRYRTFFKCDVYSPFDIETGTDITKVVPVKDYDSALLLEVLEHTTDPVAALRNTRECLKVGGLLLFSVPLEERVHHKYDFWRFTEKITYIVAHLGFKLLDVAISGYFGGKTPTKKLCALFRRR